jgi:hypothetical protein
MLAIEGHHDEHAEAHDVVEEMPNGDMGPTLESLTPQGQAA